MSLDETAALRFRFPADYPEYARLQVELIWTGAGDAQSLKKNLTKYIESLPLGEEMAFAAVTCCQELLADGVAEESGLLKTSLGRAVPSENVFVEQTEGPSPVRTQRCWAPLDPPSTASCWVPLV